MLYLTLWSALSSLKLARMDALSFWMTALSSAMVFAARTLRMNCLTVWWRGGQPRDVTKRRRARLGCLPLPPSPLLPSYRQLLQAMAIRGASLTGAHDGMDRGPHGGLGAEYDQIRGLGPWEELLGGFRQWMVEPSAHHGP